MGNYPELHGAWRGQAISADSMNTGNTTLTVIQRESELTGTWSVQFPGMANGGTIEGTVTEPGDLSLTLKPSTVNQCALIVGGKATTGQMTGVYSTDATKCPYSLAGTVDMIHQTTMNPTYTFVWPPGGMYDKHLTVSLEADTLNPPVKIYYTLDGTQPEPGKQGTVAGDSPLEVALNAEGEFNLNYMSIDDGNFKEPAKLAQFHIGVAPPIQELVLGAHKAFLPAGFVTTPKQPVGDF